MGGGSANTNTTQDNGIDITTNAGAGSINNYSHLTVHGSGVSNQSAAKGAGVKVKASYSGPPPVLQNLYAEKDCDTAKCSGSLMEMYTKCETKSLQELYHKCDSNMLVNLHAQAAHPDILMSLYNDCKTTQTTNACKGTNSGAAFISASAAVVVLGAAAMC